MSSNDDTRDTSVAANIRQYLPADCDPDRARAIFGTALRALMFAPINESAGVNALGHLVRQSIELGSAHAGEPIVLLDKAACRAFARRMVVGMDALWSEEVADGPLPPNDWMVSAHNESVMFNFDGMRRMSKPDAVNLAVWLIALADPALELAPALLLKVATRP